MKAVLLFAFATFCGAAQAQSSDKQLVVKSGTGEKLSQSALSDVHKITFGESEFTVNKKDGSSERFDYTSVIAFMDDATGIKSAELSKGGLKVTSTPGSTLIRIEGAKSGSVEVYNTGGSRVLRIAKWGGQPVDVGSLPKGIYILQVGKQRFKFSK